MKELSFRHEEGEKVLKNVLKTMDNKKYTCVNNVLWEEDRYNRGVFIKRLRYDRKGNFDKIHLYIKHENASKGYASKTQFIFRFHCKNMEDLMLELVICDLTRTKINKMINIHN